MSASPESGVPPWSGPWANDARRLFQVLQEQLQDGADPDQAHPPECRYCPFCQGVALLRRAGPDVLDQLSELAAGLAATLRASDESSDQGDEEALRTPGPTADPVPPSTVRIDVTD